MNPASKAVGQYLHHLNAHDVETAAACLADDFQLEFQGSDYAMSKADTLQALAWDAGVKGRIEWRVTDAGRDSVVIEGHETNEFLSLLDIGPLPFRSTFRVNAERLIERQLHDVDWGSRTLAEAMQPLIEWASEHAPTELAAVYPDGRMIYTRESAEGWIALAKRWRDKRPA